MLITFFVVVLLVSASPTLQTTSASQVSTNGSASTERNGVFSLGDVAAIPIGSSCTDIEQPTAANSKAPPHVEKLLVVKAKILGRDFTASMADINTTMKNNVQTYYKEVSYNQTVIEATVIPANYTMSHGESYYSASPATVLELVQEVLTKANGDVTAVGGYSVFKHIVVMHSGEDKAMPPNTEGAVISEYLYNPDGTSPIATVGSVNIMNACVVSNRDPLGVIVHEIGHSMGLKDLYDYAASAQLKSDDFVGTWDLMAEGAWNPKPYGTSPAHPTTFCKIELGWIDSSEIVDISQNSIQAGNNATVLLTPQELASGTQVIRIALNNGTYLLVENRQKIGFDTALLSVGVLVLYCDDSKPSGEGPVMLLSGYPPSLGASAPYNVGVVANKDFFGDQSADIGIKVLNKWANGTFKVLVGPWASVRNASSEYTSLFTVPVTIVIIGCVAFLGLVLVIYLKKGRTGTVKGDGSVLVIKIS
jgi:M6 family metalloprotease-like protein